MKYSVIIPAYNEALRFDGVMDALWNEFYRELQDNEMEIIVVDDGSRDNTVEVVQRYSVQLIKHVGNRGKGAAVRNGFQAASGEVIGFVDSDQSVKAEDIRTVFEAAPAVAERTLRLNFPWYRKLSSKFYNTLIRGLFKIDYDDTQCGCKAFPHDVAKQLAQNQIMDGFAFDVEYLQMCKKLGVVVERIPLEEWVHEEHPTFRIKWQAGSLLWNTLWLWWKKK